MCHVPRSVRANPNANDGDDGDDSQHAHLERPACGLHVDQLNRFARGERQATVMGAIAARLSEADKRAVAEFLSGRP